MQDQSNNQSGPSGQPESSGPTFEQMLEKQLGQYLAEAGELSARISDLQKDLEGRAAALKANLDSQIAEQRKNLDAHVADLRLNSGPAIEGLRQQKAAVDSKIRAFDSFRKRLSGEIVDALPDDASEWPRTASDKVVSLLERVGHPLHYREIYRRLAELGVVTTRSARPAETFLRNYYKDVRLFRPKRGTYFLAAKQRGAKSVGSRRRSKPDPEPKEGSDSLDT